MFDDLPKFIRVGGFDVRVEIKDKIEEPGESAIFGTYSHTDMLIEIRTAQPGGAFAVDTVLHELGHAIYADRDMHKSDNEERVVGQMSRGYTQLFRDNPALLAWMTKLLG